MAKPITYADLTSGYQFWHHDRKFVVVSDPDPLGNGLVTIEVKDKETGKARVIRTPGNGTVRRVGAYE